MSSFFEVLLAYWLLLFVVITGGRIGNLLCKEFFSLNLMVLTTGMLVLVVSQRMAMIVMDTYVRRLG